MYSCPKESINNKMMFMNTSTSSNYNSTEEFSFPVISNNPLSNFMLSSSSASSSSLWRISSRVYHHQEEYQDKEEEEDEDDDYYDMEVRSMCEEILPSRRESIIACASFRSKDLEVEESMDYLWEDFNEEEKIQVKERKNYGEELSSVLQLTTKMSRKHSSSSRRRRSSKMLMLGKMVKGLVSVMRSAQHKFLKTRYEAKEW